MNSYSQAEAILKTMLERLGFEVSITVSETVDGICFDISSFQSKYIIGKNGDRIEDIQYLLNRIISIKDPELPRIKVDCEGFRKEQERQLLETVYDIAEKVRTTEKSIRTRPLNSYYRRIVHNAFVEVDDITTSTPSEESRFKRVIIAKVE